MGKEKKKREEKMYFLRKESMDECEHESTKKEQALPGKNHNISLSSSSYFFCIFDIFVFFELFLLVMISKIIIVINHFIRIIFEKY